METVFALEDGFISKVMTYSTKDLGVDNEVNGGMMKSESAHNGSRWVE